MPHVAVGTTKERIMLTLVEAKARYTEQIAQLKQAFQQCNEHMDGSAMIEQFEALDDWFDFLNQLKSEDTLPHKDLVRSICFLAIDEANRVVGMSDLRFDIEKNAYLNHVGGHIGYCIHPDYRRRGYGTQLLALVKAEAKKQGLSEIVVACDADNVASEKIIGSNGGQWLNAVIDESDGKMVKRFKIIL